MAVTLSDDLLGEVHWVLGGIAAACGIYNGLRTMQEPNVRNAVNAAVYFGLWRWERNRMLDHHAREANG